MSRDAAAPEHDSLTRHAAAAVSEGKRSEERKKPSSKQRRTPWWLKRRAKIPNGSAEAAHRLELSSSASAVASRAPLTCLPAELLFQIFRYLPLSSLLSLSQVSHSAKTAVDGVGWEAWLFHEDAQRWTILPPNVPQGRQTGKRQRLDARLRVQQLLRRDDIWRDKTFGARQVMFSDLPWPIGAGDAAHGESAAAASRTARSQPLFTSHGQRSELGVTVMALSDAGLFVAIRSYIVFWSSLQLSGAGSISSSSKSDRPRVIHMTKPKQARAGSANVDHTEPSAWEDICSLEALPHHGDNAEASTLGNKGKTRSVQHLALGRLNGSLELWSFPLGNKGHERLTPIQLSSFSPEGSRRTSLQKLCQLPSRSLLAGVWKNGLVAVFQVSPSCAAAVSQGLQPAATSPGACLRQLRSWRIDNVCPWTIHMGDLGSSSSSLPGQSSPWLAVGCQAKGKAPLLLYRDFCSPFGNDADDQEAALQPSDPEAEELLDEAPCAVYALASAQLQPSRSSGSEAAGLPFAAHLLFAGCYDGTVRVLDVRKGAKGTVALYKDAYDDSPVYSLTLGVGAKSQSFGVGTARHGIVKIYAHPADRQGGDSDCESRSCPDVINFHEGYSIFPPRPTARCPTYAVVGDHGRLFAVGSDRVWEIDARQNFSRSSASASSRIETLSYYMHREMSLRQTVSLVDAPPVSTKDATANERRPAEPSVSMPPGDNGKLRRSRSSNGGSTAGNDSTNQKVSDCSVVAPGSPGLHRRGPSGRRGRHSRRGRSVRGGRDALPGAQQS